MVGRLVSYKKFDLAIRVFNRLGLPLKIAGTGIEHQRLAKLAGPNVELLGQVDDDRLTELYQQAKAVVFPQEEDFGIVPLEAMASGRPVIAYRGGGALETIIDGKTGIFFNEQTEESLEAALARFEGMEFTADVCREQAEKFDVEVLEQRYKRFCKGRRIDEERMDAAKGKEGLRKGGLPLFSPSQGDGAGSEKDFRGA